VSDSEQWMSADSDNISLASSDSRRRDTQEVLG